MTAQYRKTKSFPAKLAGAMALVAVTFAGTSAAMAQSERATVPGTTKPKHEPKLSFYGPGIVAKLNVEEGQAVKAGEVLAIQNDIEEVAKLETAKGEYVSAEFQIEAAVADLKLKEAILHRTEKIYPRTDARNNGFAELEKAQADVDVAHVAERFRRHDLEQKKIEIRNQEKRVDLRKLVSPVDGVVSKIDVKVGEGSDLSKPAITVVQTTTLYVEAELPPSKSKSLKVGDTLKVAYEDEKDQWMDAKIIFLTSYANPSSGGRKVRLEMPNTSNREAGLRLTVKLPEVPAATPAAASADALKKG